MLCSSQASHCLTRSICQRKGVSDGLLSRRGYVGKADVHAGLQNPHGQLLGTIWASQLRANLASLQVPATTQRAESPGGAGR